MDTGLSKFDRVMIVDDNNIDIYIAKQMIKKNNFAENIITFNCPFEAFKYLKTITDVHFLPNIILLDLNLDGVSGFEFLNCFESLTQEIKNLIKVYMVSSTVDQRDIARIKQNKNVSGFSEKHITEQFLDSIPCFLSKKTSKTA